MRPLHLGWLLGRGCRTGHARRGRTRWPARQLNAQPGAGSKLTIIPKRSRLIGMHHLLRPRSRLFRSLSILALLAWTAFAFDAFAHPLVMAGGSAGMASMATGDSASQCDGMPNAAHHPAPSNPAGSGHGCCQNGGCYCASLCSGIAGVPYLGTALQPVHDPAVSLIHSDPTPVHSAPPLRPPIA